MRRLNKAQKPAILEAKEAEWLADVAANPSVNNKTRYRHHEIKLRLIEETNEKCVYCESSMRPTSPSHIEHKIPASTHEHLRFSWDNLTIACAECNRRKNDFYDQNIGFLDPYNDDVENRLTHRGPIVGWRAGDNSAELSVKHLGLDGERTELILKKIEKINEIDNLIERYQEKHGTALEPIIRKQLRNKCKFSAEYSAMVRSIFANAGLAELID